jgi:hypothetical protein
MDSDSCRTVMESFVAPFLSLGGVPILSSLVPCIHMQPCLLAPQCCVAVKERGCNIWMAISLVCDSPWTQPYARMFFAPLRLYPHQPSPSHIESKKTGERKASNGWTVFALLCSYPIPFSTFCLLRVAFLHRTIQRYFSWKSRCRQSLVRIVRWTACCGSLPVC